MARAASSGSRDVRIDGLKGFAIVAVVIYHTMGQYLVTAPKLALYSREFLFSFMLPLFAFLSGYVLGRRGSFKPRDYFLRRTVGLMVPYVCWEIIYGLGTKPETRVSLGAFGRYLLGIMWDPHLEGRMWYLYVLWIALMLIGAARWAGKDRTWVIVASLVLVMVFPWYGHFMRLKWIYLYVVAGLLARRYEPVYLPRIKAIGIAGAVAFVPLWLLSRPEKLMMARIETALAGTQWTQPALTGLYAISTLAGVAAVAAILAASYSAPGWLENALAVPGRLSLGIYLTHFELVEIWHDPSPWLIPVIVVFALAGSMLATVLLARWRVTATLLLGERWRKKSLPLGDVETETL